MDVEELVGPSALQPEVFEIITYALKLAWTAETYNVHSWMVLLGLLKKESYVACQVRRAVEQQQAATTAAVCFACSAQQRCGAADGHTGLGWCVRH
jgi:hypothetical protein